MREIKIEDLQQLLKTTPQLDLVDCRELDETASGVLPGARIVPLSTLRDEPLEKQFKHTEMKIVFYCASGRRSLIAAEMLANQGFSDTASLQGGIHAWRDVDLPTVLPGATELSEAEMNRYQRQLTLPQLGVAGQLKLKESRVTIVGAGGLGSPVATYLAAAGVGKLTLIDNDKVELSNLHRQPLHATEKIGQNKVTSATQTLTALNPEIQVVGHAVRLSRDNAEQLLQNCDVIVDAADNFPTRYLINEVALRLAIPWVYGAVERFTGQLSVFAPKLVANSACYRCLYPEAPPPGTAPSCDEAGVLGVLPGLIGILQATETLKLLLKLGEPLVGRLLVYQALVGSFSEHVLVKDPRCNH